MENTMLVNPGIRNSDQLHQLLELMRDRNHLLIVLQDNPDPDAIASAVALKFLAKERENLSSTIAFGGVIGRSENRSLVRYLDIIMYPWDWVDMSKFDITALVDTQPGSGNNSFPLDRAPQIVIDHHPPHQAYQDVPFTDIRADYGATATILWEYLSQANLTPNMLLATAMIYAIRSDTQDLGLEATTADRRADEELYPLADKFILSKIIHGRLPRKYFKIVAHALQTARLYQDCLIAALGDVPHPDIVGEVADLLLREDETQWVLCMGKYLDRIWLSLRTVFPHNRADQVVKQIVKNIGTGGGHFTRAGGQIPLVASTDSEYQSREKQIRERFLLVLDRDSVQKQSLIL